MKIENVVALLFIMGGVAIIFNLVTIAYFYLFTIKKWVKVNAVVTNYEIDQDGSDPDYSGWENSIRYLYEVNGRQIEGSSLTKNIRFLKTNIKDVERNPKYYQGNIIEIYYNPTMPQQTVADNKFNYYNLAVLIMAGISFTVAYYTWE